MMFSFNKWNNILTLKITKTVIQGVISVMWNVDVEGADIQEQPRQFIKSEFQIYVLALLYS